MDFFFVIDHRDEYIDASLLASLPDLDLCLLKLSAPLEGAAPLPISPDSGSAAVGSAVFALGFPASGDVFTDSYAYALDEITLTSGAVSSLKSSGPMSLLQSTAPIDHGSSGGPLLDAQGRVVGVNTYGVDGSQGMYAAVAASHLLALLEGQAGLQLAQPPAFPWLPVLLAAGGALLLAAILLLVLRHRRRARRAAQQPQQGQPEPSLNAQYQQAGFPPAQAQEAEAQPSFQSQREYAAALSSQYQPAAQDEPHGQPYPPQNSAYQQQNPNAQPQPPLSEVEISAAQPKVKKPRRRWSRKAKALACVLAAVVLLGSAAGVWLALDAQAQERAFVRAESLARDGHFEQAQAELASVSDSYQGADQLRRYLDACLSLQNGDYTVRSVFQSMPGYLNSAQMLLECDYQEAAALLQDGQFDQAKELFSALADQNYADADQQVLECEYQEAEQFYERKAYIVAAQAFEQLYVNSSYRDSFQRTDDCYYEAARQMLDQNQYILTIDYYEHRLRDSERWNILLEEVLPLMRAKCLDLYSKNGLGSFHDIRRLYRPYSNYRRDLDNWFEKLETERSEQRAIEYGW